MAEAWTDGPTRDEYPVKAHARHGGILHSRLREQFWIGA
jgi:hypothetical protein